MFNSSTRTLRVLAIAGLAAVASLGTSLQAQNAQRSNQQRQENVQVRLEKEVRHILVTEPFYTLFDNLAFQVNGDHVTLLGQVVNPALKIDAGRDVKSIEGVSSVDNQIELLPVSPIDNRIRLAEYRAIYSAPGFQKYSIQAVPPIHIIVKNGHVTLMGVVDSTIDKTLAATRAKSVSGVFSVDDQLRVQK
jgi:osmotically-inducible protein OsmY